MRLLREHAAEAGLNPFIESLSAAERLAMLLDRVDELPLRRHEIRGNVAGLLARLVRPDRRAQGGRRRPGAVPRVGRRARPRRAAERRRRATPPSASASSPSFYELHDAMLREAGAIDGGEAVLELTRLLGRAARARRGDRRALPAPDRRRARGRLPGRARADRAAGAAAPDAWCSPATTTRAAPAAAAAAAWARDTLEDLDEVALEPAWRYGGDLLDAAHAVVAPIEDRAERLAARGGAGDRRSRFWRCANERAEAQAVAREIESALAAGRARGRASASPSPPRRPARAHGRRGAGGAARAPPAVAAPGAFFQRPEVRDVIAWLRLLADPTDAAAAVRALSRPPVELRSVDLARCTTIARRRKLDMVSALEASLESPQIPPEARDRIRSFLNLYNAAARAMGELPADVFVRRLIERIGFRRQRLFAAHPEAASGCATSRAWARWPPVWTRREPGGSNRDFVRYLVAVSEAGVSPEEEHAPPRRRTRSGSIPLDALKGLEFDRVYVVGLHADGAAGPGAGRRARRCRWRSAAARARHEDAPAPPALHGDDPGARTSWC